MTHLAGIVGQENRFYCRQMSRFLSNGHPLFEK